MTNRESTQVVSAKESVWSDGNSLLSSESAGSAAHSRHGRLPSDADKPPLSAQPLHPSYSSIPVANSSHSSASRKSKKKKKGKGKSKNGKKHKKSKSKSQKAAPVPVSAPSTSKQHRKSMSIASRQKIFPVTGDEDESSLARTSAGVPSGRGCYVGSRFQIGRDISGFETNVMTSVPTSGDETENAIVLAVREIRRLRERITELEEHVRHLSESYGIDPESLLMPESLGASAGSSTVLRKGARGIRVSVEEPGQAITSSHLTSSDTSEDHSQQLTTPSTVVSPSHGVVVPDLPNSPHGRVGPMVPEERPLSEEQKMANIMTKLQKLTGRKMSLEEISPLLRARTADEALRNGRMLRTAEHLKRVYGGRPENYICVTTVAPAIPTSAPATTTSAAPDFTPTEKASTSLSPQHSHTHQHQHVHSHKETAGNPEEDAEAYKSMSHRERARLRKKKSRSVFDFSSLRPIDGEDDDEDSESKPPPDFETAELTNETTFGLRIEKLSRLTGRRGSLSEIRGLLLPTTAEEAKKCAQSLYTVEKLKKRYGERPSVEQPSPSPPPPQ